MSHVTCQKCGSGEHYQGYGFACGGVGVYTICECGHVIEFCQDRSYAHLQVAMVFEEVGPK